MYKYTIKAYNHDATIGAVEAIQVVVTAPDEEQAIKRAGIIVARQNYAVMAIEDLQGSELKKTL